MKALYFILLLFFISFQGNGQIASTDPKEVISVYPNPAVSTLWVNISNNEIEEEDIKVYNVLGNQLNSNVEKLKDGRFSINVNELPAGYYLLVVENKAEQLTKTVKFLKK